MLSSPMGDRTMVESMIFKFCELASSGGNIVLWIEVSFFK